MTGMNANLQAMVSEYAMITFPASIENEGDGNMTLKVGMNELSKLIEKEMACRLELPDRTSRNVKIKGIERNSDELFLLCCSIR
jgi:hypothetical protein